jgi:hypothetical protein
MSGPKAHQVNIVGGGIAGLLAAVELARGGARVTVFEAAGAFGGRARTRQADGFFLNQGPHALYLGGAFRRELKRLGVAFSGGRALATTRKTIWKGALQDLPVDMRSLMRTKLFGFGDKIAYVRLLNALGKGVVAEGSFADWLDTQKLSPVMRAALEALARLGLVAAFAGFGFKIAAFPFHMWVPDTYEAAPTPFVAWLSVAPKAAGFVALLRVYFDGVGPETARWVPMAAGLATVTIVAGNLMALPQQNAKRLLA